MILALVLWAAFAVLPGLAILRLLHVPLPITTMAAAAVPLSFGGVYLVALVATRLGLSVRWCSFSAIGLLLLVWVVFEVRVERRRRSMGAERRQFGLARTQVVGAGFALAAVVLGLVLWSELHSALTVPSGWDAMHHGFFIRQIVDRDTLAPSVVLSSDSIAVDGTTGFYPLAFNLAAALLHEISGVPISVLMLTSTTALAGVLLPCTVYRWVFTLRPSPMVAGFAAVATTLPINLYTIEYTGRITAILGLAMVPAGVLLLVETGRRLTPDFWLFGAVTTIGVTGMHTSETPLLFAMVAVFALFRWWGSWVHLLRFVVCLVGSAVVAAIVLVAAEPGVLHLVGERSGALGPDGGHQGWPAALRAVLTEPQFGHQGMAAFTMAALVGSALTVHPRLAAYRPAAASYLGFVAFYLGFVTHALGPLSFLGLPWYRDPARMMWVLALLGSIPAGVLLAVVATGTRWVLVRSTSRLTISPRALARSLDVAAPLVILLLVVVLFRPAVRAESDGLLSSASPVTPDYQAAFTYLAAHQQPGQRVLDDLRNHGDLWMFVDDGVRTVFGNAPLIGLAPDSWKERLYLRGHLADVGTDPCIGQLLKGFDVDYVFYAGGLMAGGTPRIALKTLRDPRLFREVFTRGSARVFRVIAPPVPGTCTKDLTHAFPWTTVANAN